MSRKIKYLLIIFFGLAVIVFLYFKGSFLPAVQAKAEGKFVLVYHGNNLQNVADSLVARGYINSSSELLKTARLMRFSNDDLREGRFKIIPGWNLIRLLDEMARGPQVPVKLVINPVRTIENLAALIGKNLEYDSIHFIETFLNPELLRANVVDTANALSLFIPNTYEFFWNISPESFMQKMVAENKKFWSARDRVERLDSLHLSKDQVYTLASIVDKESRNNSEKPAIAGLYLNRLKNNMRLQADPTVVFANGDFTVKRISQRMVELNSPYNTYRVDGLPPGPIYMASIAGIDAVLHYEKHEYLYMVARPDYSGFHDFSETFESHRQKANKYRDWLTSQGLGL